MLLSWGVQPMAYGHFSMGGPNSNKNLENHWHFDQTVYNKKWSKKSIVFAKNIDFYPTDQLGLGSPAFDIIFFRQKSIFGISQSSDAMNYRKIIDQQNLLKSNQT
jgi:hypothetical protein